MNFEDQLKELKGKLDKRLELFFAKIKARDKFLDFSYKTLASYMRSGKRLRAASLVMVYQGFGGLNKEIYDIALSVEFMHNSTLIHDDVMDEDTSRRNRPTMHELMRKYFLKYCDDKASDGPLFNKVSSRFAATNAICGGTILFSLGSLFLSSSSLDPALVQKALKCYSNAGRLVNQGQIMDTLFEIKDATEKDYIDMIEQKTADLFKASFKIGAILAGVNDKEVELISEYARLIAIAFQIQDDIMDISEDMNKGHEIGSDIKNGKKTLLVIKALEKSRKKDKDFLSKVLKTKDADQDDIKRSISIIKNSGSLDYCRKFALEKAYQAKRCLEKISLNKEAYDFFSGLTDFVVNRDI